MDNVTLGKVLFSGGGWATRQLKAAALNGRALTAQALRTLDTLRHDEWKHFDDALVEEAVIRLVGVADLIGAGLVRPVSNALGKTVFGYEKVTDMDEATVSMNGLGRSPNDKQEFDLNLLPLPITHKDFFLDLRTLAASREKGESLDVTQARTAGRVVAEKLEYMLFNGGPTFGAMPIYGYRTHPDRVTSGFGTNGDWGQAAKTGENMLADVLTMISGLHAKRMFGPYWIYVPSDAGVRLANDFKANSDKSIMQRLSEVPGIKGIRVADQLPSSNVVMVQATMDTAAWVNGENIQTVQWDEAGGFLINFKAFAIGVPLIRSDADARCGVYHMSD